MKLLPADDRPREKLIEHGPDILSNSELLAILIRTGTPQRSALDIARELTDDDGFYSNIAKARSVADLSKIKGLGPAKAATILAAVELGRRVAGAQPQKKIRFSSPEACVNFLMPRLRYEGNEKFVVMLLDSKNQLIKMQQVSEGSLNASVVHPREVFAPAVLHRAACVLAAHNHPSGDPAPSREDRRLTSALKETGIVMGIPLLDHIIIGDGRYFSFRENGRYFSFRENGYLDE